MNLSKEYHIQIAMLIWEIKKIITLRSPPTANMNLLMKTTISQKITCIDSEKSNTGRFPNLNFNT
jgi:hypothetical protein